MRVDWYSKFAPFYNSALYSVLFSYITGRLDQLKTEIAMLDSDTDIRLHQGRIRELTSLLKLLSPTKRGDTE